MSTIESWWSETWSKQSANLKETYVASLFVYICQLRVQLEVEEVQARRRVHFACRFVSISSLHDAARHPLL